MRSKEKRSPALRSFLRGHNIMKINKKEIPNDIAILTAAIILLVSFIGSVFIYMPFRGSAKKVESGISIERNRNVLIAKTRVLREHLNAYLERMPKSSESSWLLEEVSNIASKERIEVSSIKAGSPEKIGHYTKLYVLLEVYSTYHQLGKFLSKIESQEKFFKVETLNMKRLDFDENFERLAKKYKAFDVKANIIIATLVLKE